MIMFAVARSILLTSSNYDAFEANGAVRICAVVMAEAIERTIIVQLNSQDSTATSKHNKYYSTLAAKCSCRVHYNCSATFFFICPSICPFKAFLCSLIRIVLEKMYIRCIYSHERIVIIVSLVSLSPRPNFL